MHYGFVLSGGDIWTMPEMAAEAEAAGWEGYLFQIAFP